MIELPGGNGVAVALDRGQRLRLVNTHGNQVVDSWALMAADPTEYMSMEQSRRMTGHLHPEPGDVLCSNRRRPMLRIVEERFDGTHDTIVACCDRWLYAHYGCDPGHANCHDNYLSALRQVGIEPHLVPNPLNLWMNVPVVDNDVTITSPLSKPGDFIVLLAEADVMVVLSACPMDLPPASGATAINGPDLKPAPVHYRVE
ncbi:MAG: urea carboxylase-associated family protein [Pseudomonadota bacterium]